MESERFRSFVVQHLFLEAESGSRDDREQIAEWLVALLQDRHVAVKRESMLALARLRNPTVIPTVDAVLADGSAASDGLRDVAIRCAHMLNLKQHLSAIRKLLWHNDESTSIAAAVVLSAWGGEEDKEALKKCSTSAPPRVAKAAEAALKRMDRASQ